MKTRMHMGFWVLVWLLALLEFARPNCCAQAEEKPRLGVITELTGNASSYGVDIKNALLFANQRLAHSKYQLLFEDDKCSGKDAVSAAQKLVAVDRIKHVIGLGCSGSVLASAPVFEKAKVLLISPGTSAPLISDAGDYIFRTWPSDSIAVEILYDYIASRHSRVGLLAEETDYCQGQVKEFQKRNKGGRVSFFSQSFVPGEPDIKPSVLRLSGNNLDALFVSAQSESEFLVLVKQLRQLNISMPLYNIYNAGSGAFLEAAGKDAEGIVFADLPLLEEVGTPEGQRLFKEFVDRFGKPASWDLLWATSFEAFRALDQAVSSGQDAREYLYTQKFNGVFGEWSFDRRGDIVGVKQVLRVIKDGKPVRLAEQ